MPYADVSINRVSNVCRAFYFIYWDTKSVEVIRKSYDLPTFIIKGVYRHNKKEIPVMWQSKHPGGNSPKFSFSHEMPKRISQGITGYSPAYLHNAEIIREFLYDMTL